MTQLRVITVVAVLAAGLSSYASAQGLPPLAHLMVGSQSQYIVKAGDSLVSIGARKGIESNTLAAMNDLKPKTPLKPGQVLTINDRHIVPADLSDGILINLPQRILFLLTDGKVESNYPIGPGKAAFATPIGSFSVIQMRENPTWYVPQSIQQEWARAGKVVKRAVPPGPRTLWAAIGSDSAFHRMGFTAPISRCRSTTSRAGVACGCILRMLALYSDRSKSASPAKSFTCPYCWRNSRTAEFFWRRTAIRTERRAWIRCNLFVSWRPPTMSEMLSIGRRLRT